MKPVDPFLIIGERINASGRKRLQKGFQEMDFTDMLDLARQQEEEGSTIIDVNLGIEKLLTHEHFKQAVLELDKISSLPFPWTSKMPSSWKLQCVNTLVGRFSTQHWHEKNISISDWLS